MSAIKICRYYLTELNELRKENDLQKEVIAELQEDLSKNKSQDNNTRLQWLIDEVFGLLNEYDSEYGYDKEVKRRINIRLKIINTLK
jgi:hypothetical protein